MLKTLTLENIAIIEALTVDFEAGLTIITGETGAGKSILIEGITLAFGQKISPKDILRSGCERGRVELSIDLTQHPQPQMFRSLLDSHGIEWAEGETELLLSREFTPTQSRLRLNGTPVTRDVVEQIRPWVLDFHSQHELTGLLQPAIQRACLDGQGDTAFWFLKKQVKETYSQWKTLQERVTSLRENFQETQRQRDFLAFQLAELQEADLNDPNEDSQCRQLLDQLAHGEKLRHLSGEAVAILSSGGGWGEETSSVLDLLGKVQKKLTDGAKLDGSLETLLERATAMMEESRALYHELADYHENLNLDPESLQTTVNRVDLLEKLKRKYGPTLAEVIATRETVAARLQESGDTTEELAHLEIQLQAVEAQLDDFSNQLTLGRQILANQLKESLTRQLQTLALPAATFDVAFDTGGFSAEGKDSVTFLFSANPGEPLRPLAQVASGGELSRFLLALKVLTAGSGVMQTLLFDEIDTGMSGVAAKAVGEKLNQLAQHYQVLVITHQPIVAALGDHHLHVQKRFEEASSSLSGEESARVRVEVLYLEEKEMRLSTLSRLASGIDTNDEVVEKYVARLLEEAAILKANCGLAYQK